MVGVMRLLAALMLVGVAACASTNAAPRDLSGVWIAPELQGDSAGFFRAELVQDARGRLSGVGVVDSCTRCRGLMEYALNWEGGLEGDVLVLTGTPNPVRGRYTPVRFEGHAVGEGFEGVITGINYNETMRVRMERAPSSE